MQPAPLQLFIDKAVSQHQRPGSFEQGQFDWNIKNDDDWNLLNTAMGKPGTGGKCKPIIKALQEICEKKYIQHHVPAKATSSSYKRKRDKPMSESRKKGQEQPKERLTGGNARW